MTIHRDMFDKKKIEEEDTDIDNYQVYKAAGLTAGEIRDMPRYIAGIDEFYGTPAFDKLYNYFVFEASHIVRMPYGAAKARDRMPDDWILEKLSQNNK